MVGQRFERLTVVRRGESKTTAAFWVCICDCGSESVVRGVYLRTGRTKSCGCLHRESITAIQTTHGMFGSGTYRSWVAMRNRCYQKSNISYGNYGGRGIRVCGRWDLFENFYADMGDRPAGMTLDRKRVNEDYGPTNCKWSTRLEQNNNKRNNVSVTFGGRTQTYAQWAVEIGINASTLRARFIKSGNFEIPDRKRKDMK